jgi:Asparagine synthase
MQLEEYPHPTSAQEQFLAQSINQTPLLALVWLKEKSDPQDARKIVRNMLRHSYGPYGQSAIIGGEAGLAWGMLLPDNPSPLTAWSIHVNGKELCIVEGDFHSDPPGLRLEPGENPELAFRVARQMRKNPDGQIKDLIGIYSGIYVNDDGSCAYAFGDPTGTRPILWTSDERRFVVTGSLWAFKGCDGFQRRLDSMALMEMFTLAVPLLGRTWLASVRQLQHGRQVRSFADGRTEVRMLLEPVQRASWSFKQSIRVLRESMDVTVSQVCTRLGQPVGLGLSGGLDSRILLASLHTQHIGHQNFTFCLDPQEPDNRIAKAAAELLGEKHKTVVLNSTNAHLHRDIRLVNEGESPAFGYFSLALQIQQDTGTLMMGYPADLFAGAPLGPFRPLAVKNKADLADRMLRMYTNQFSPMQARKILAEPFHVAWEDILDEWRESFKQIEQESIMDIYLDHALDYRVQRRARLRLDAARWFCLPLYPYMDERLYSAYRSLPLNHLKGERAHIALLCDYKTGLENIPSAQRNFSGMPIYKEYRYRDLIHLGRIVRQRLISPLTTKWRETKGTFGFGQNGLNSMLEAELPKLKGCSLFNWPEMENLIERARRGTFLHREAMHRLVSTKVIDDFLFESGSSKDTLLHLRECPREITFQAFAA